MPPFENVENYYTAPLTHVTEKNCNIRQTLILPLINKQILTQSKKLNLDSLTRYYMFCETDTGIIDI